MAVAEVDRFESSEDERKRRRRDAEIERARSSIDWEDMSDLLDDESLSEDARLYPTGIAGLDNLIGGGMVAGLYVMGGAPKQGKTALALFVAARVAHDLAGDERAAVCELDMRQNEANARLLSMCSTMSGGGARPFAWSAIRNSGHDDRLAALDAYSRMTGNRLRVYDGYHLDRTDDTPTWDKVREQVEEYDIARYRLRFLCIDFLQLIGGDGGRTVAQDDDLEEEVLGWLRDYAYERGCVVLLLSEVTKEAQARVVAKGGAPSMCDLMGGAGLAHTATAVMECVKREGKADVLTVHVVACRNGSDGVADVRADWAHNTFS